MRAHASVAVWARDVRLGTTVLDLVLKGSIMLTVVDREVRFIPIASAEATVPKSQAGDAADEQLRALLAAYGWAPVRRRIRRVLREIGRVRAMPLLDIDAKLALAAAEVRLQLALKSLETPIAVARRAA